MNINGMPIGLLLLTTVILVVISIEMGYRTGKFVHRKREMEKEATVSSISGYVLALLAFIIAFTFGIVTDRYETRKTLVREEANGIRDTWLRADFLPDTDRIEARELLQKYTVLRLQAVKSLDSDTIQQALAASIHIQDQLWNMAVRNGRQDLNSDVAALYIESLNEIIDINATRVAIALHTRIPEGLWEVLLLLMLLSMFSVGYQTAISGSGRSWVNIILAVSFSLVIVMIETIDRPQSRLMPISQFPMEYLIQSMQDVPGNK